MCRALGWSLENTAHTLPSGPATQLGRNTCQPPLEHQAVGTVQSRQEGPLTQTGLWLEGAIARNGGLWAKLGRLYQTTISQKIQRKCLQGGESHLPRVLQQRESIVLTEPQGGERREAEGLETVVRRVAGEVERWLPGGGGSSLPDSSLPCRHWAPREELKWQSAPAFHKLISQNFRHTD